MPLGTLGPLQPCCHGPAHGGHCGHLRRLNSEGTDPYTLIMRPSLDRAQGIVQKDSILLLTGGGRGALDCRGNHPYAVSESWAKILCH